MRALRHTFPIPIPGYEALEITIDIGLTNEQVDHGQANGQHVFVLDFPNWDEVAEALEMFTDDPATGKPTTTPMPKPEMPLTHVALSGLPVVLGRYIGGGYVINDACTHFMENMRRPN